MATPFVVANNIDELARLSSCVLRKENMEWEVYVHDGVFHADDVLCVALLKAFVCDNVKVIRKRLNEPDVKALAHADDGKIRVICDTGNMNGIADNEYMLALDHHDKDRWTYDNGIQYAACGKLAACIMYSFPRVLKNGAGFNKFIQSTLWPVEIQDNGQKIEELGIRPDPNLFTWISAFNNCWNEDNKEVDNRFNQAVEMTKEILLRQIKRVEGAEEARNIINKNLLVVDITIKNAFNIVVLDQFIPWQEYIVEYNKTCKPEDRKKIVVFKNLSSQWNVQCVPVDNGSFDTIVKIPEYWAGKRNEEFTKACEIDGGVFCHSGRWMCIFEEKQQAIKAAEKILDIANREEYIERKTIVV